jgi:cytochrome c
MKKVMILFAAATFIISCGNDSNNTTNATTDSAAGTEATGTEAGGPAATTETTAPGATASADADKGLDLIAKSDCLTCHKVEEKLVGPAYRDIAKKYEDTPANVDSLAGKVIHGGAGNWGQVPMTPHPAISKEDAQLMVKYVLSLK